MDNATIPSRGLRALAEKILDGLGRRLHDAEDRRAHERGWQVSSRSHGLSRTYRDPRFDQLCSCPTCLGSGTAVAAAGSDRSACATCRGTGRVFRPARRCEEEVS
jgi:hypothetical protein